MTEATRIALTNTEIGVGLVCALALVVLFLILPK